MDTTEILRNELQALRREVDAFRDENIALYNELTKQNKTLCEELIAFRQENTALKEELTRQHTVIFNSINAANSQNLKIHSTRLAGMQTAEFIAENMPAIKAFDDRENYFRHVLNMITVPDGLYIEFGVYTGASINFIAAVLPDKIIYGFDSFEGLPEIWRTDFDKGAFSRNGILPQVNENVRLVKGWFNETLPEFVRSHPQKCAFIHVDCDLYSSTKTIFGALKNQIGSGTVIAFDEYFNYPNWQKGEYKAFQEFVTETGFEFEYIARTNHEQVAIRLK